MDIPDDFATGGALTHFLVHLWLLGAPDPDKILRKKCTYTVALLDGIHLLLCCPVPTFVARQVARNVVIHFLLRHLGGRQNGRRLWTTDHSPAQRMQDISGGRREGGSTV